MLQHMAPPPVFATFMHHLSMDLLLAGSTLITLDSCLHYRLLICTVNDFGLEIPRYIRSSSSTKPPHHHNKGTNFFLLMTASKPQHPPSVPLTYATCRPEYYVHSLLFIFFPPPLRLDRPMQCDTFIPLLPQNPSLVFGKYNTHFLPLFLSICAAMTAELFGR